MQSKNRRIVYLAGFLFSIPVALTSYINSSLLKAHIGEAKTSLVYVLASLATILGMIMMPKLLTKIGNRATVVIFSILTFLTLITLATATNNFLIAKSFILYFLSFNLVFASLDVFVEDFSSAQAIGTLRGLYLTVLNFAWVLAQLISSQLINENSYKNVYLFSSFFTLIVAFIFIVSLKDFQDPIYKKVSLLKTARFFWRERNISRIYITNLILKFFYVWMIIYMPIYLHEIIGFAWKDIALIFTIMLTPFVFLSFPLGRLSDKIGEKEMLITGFITMTAFTVVIPFIHEANLILWAFVLFATRMGAATVEVMSESYFFKMENEEHPDAIAFFRNTSPVAFIIAPLVAALLLAFLPSFELLFFVLGGIILLGLYATLRIKDTA